MPKITEITTSVAKTIQLQAYEPVKLFVSVTYSANEGEHLDTNKYFDEGLKLCLTECNEKANKLNKL